MRYFIGADVGTSSCKVMIFDEEYRPQSSAARDYVVTSPRPGWAEFNPAEIWNAFCEAVREALSGLNVNLHRHSFCICCSTFGEGLIASDSENQAIYPGILSSDLRSAAIADRLENDLGRDRLFNLTGRTPHTMAVITKIIWLKENYPERVNRRTRFLDMQSWLYAQLGVGTVTDYSSVAGTMLFRIDDKQWEAEILDYAGIEIESLPESVQAGTFAGSPSPAAAQSLGFPNPEDVRIVVGAMDQMCNAVGSGTVTPGDVVCSTGTVEAVTIVLDPASCAEDLIRFNMPKAPSAVTGQFVTHTFLWDGGRSLAWFCNQFAQKQKEDAGRKGTSVYSHLLSQTPADRNIFFVPHLSGSGMPWQNPASRGAFLGLTTASDVVSAAHAIIEGVTFELKLNLDNLESLGTHLAELRVVGGGSRSDQWLQLKADVLQKDVSRLVVGEAGCMGAAILAGYGCGAFDDLGSASKRVVHVSDVFRPSDAAHYYREKFRIYRQIYPALEQINRQISLLET